MSASGQLTLQHFLRTPNKVHIVCFHPVQPWLAYVDRANGVQVFNWKTSEVLHSAEFGGVDKISAHYWSLQVMAEQDQAYWGEKTASSMEVNKTASGRVRAIAFLDVETLYWQQVSQLRVVKGRAAECMEEDVPGGEALKGQRWLLVVCDNKLVMHDMLNKKCRELPRLALEGKHPSTVAVLSAPLGSGLKPEPILALGCTDGVIRLVAFTDMRVIARLGQKSTSITSLMTLNLTHKTVRLVSGSLDGTLQVWNPFPDSRRSLSAGSNLSPSVTVKAHEGEITALELGYGPGESAIPRIYSIGADKLAAAWEVGTFKEVLRFKQPTQRTPCHSISFCSALAGSSEKCPLLLSSPSHLIYGAQTTHNGAVKRVADLTQLLKLGGKVAPKVYRMAVHPVQGNLVGVGLTVGVAILSVQQGFVSRVEVLPKVRDGKAGSNELGVVGMWDGQLLHKEFLAVQEDGCGGAKVVSPEEVMRYEITSTAALAMSGPCNVLVNPFGIVALVYPSISKFVIFRRSGPKDWEKCWEGEGNQAVWHSYAGYLAVYTEPPPIQTPALQERKSRGRMKMDQATLDAIAAAQAAMASECSVKILHVPATGAVKDVGKIDLEGDVPSQLYPGPIVGISFQKPFTDSTGTGQSLRFYDWKNTLACSPEMLAPCWMSWAREMDVCAMAYKSHVLICQSSGDFEPLTSVPIVGGVNGVWDGRQLYVSTPEIIECVVVPVGKSRSKPDLTVQVVTLASFRSGPKWLSGSLTGPQYLPQARPIGQLKVLGVRGDKLWLIDTLGQPAVITINSAGFSALRHASERDYAAARSSAAGKVSADSLASVLVGMGSKSAVEALKLPSLSLELRLQVAIEAGYLKHALVCLEALAMGCKRPEALVKLPEFRETLRDQSAMSDMSGEQSFFVASPTGMGTSPFANAHMSDTMMDINDIFVEGQIDWEAPLRKKSVNLEEQQDSSKGKLSMASANLALKLIDKAIEDRLNQVAIGASRILMDHCPAEQGMDLLVKLQSRLSERGKQQELKEMTELSERAKMTASGRLTGLAAAALSGDALLMTNVLKDLKMLAM